MNNEVKNEMTNQVKHPVRTPGGAVTVAAVLLAGLGLGTAARAGNPVPLSEREMSGVHAQGLAEPTVEALSRRSGASNGGFAADPNTAGGFASSLPGQLLASLSTEAARGLERQLAAQELQVASSGLQNTINLSNLMVDAARFQAPLAAVPALNLPFLFAFPVLPVLPTLPPPSQDHNGGGH